MKKVLGKYKNGNYAVIMLEDGTKIRYNPLDHFKPDFPESIDMKICNRCNRGCRMCHECSTPDGALADLNAPFLDTLRPYTELAIGGGNPLEHPGLTEFLMRMKKQKVICNMTVHLDHFAQYYRKIKSYIDSGLIHGLGISVHKSLLESEIRAIEKFPNAVVHVIAGVASERVFDSIAGHNLKLLILGYKTFGRGLDDANQHRGEIRERLDWLRANLKDLSEEFPMISFDNLAIRQLDVKAIVGEEEWERLYMGDDGQYTMYVDLVENEFAVSSTSQRFPITHKTIDEMFRFVKKVSGHE